ncbi:hypothetical protein [Fictibacillus barbaricus]|uniref:Uncharacterized protein n=1 Tax=Fictibacillus barbaricus TaxID=182136 RepID=A0ABU1U5K5_9BACL|nr:hypothetical protein [Fictibacillus barbaricus]MDR7074738.1 hypothetical protein [Fictibacillus barbaricus]
MKDVNKNGNPVLYYQIYSSVNYQRNVKKLKPGKSSLATYQNMSRNNITISLGTYKGILKEQSLKRIALERAFKHFEKGNITEKDLKGLEYEFKITEDDIEKMFEDYAILKFKIFFRNNEEIKEGTPEGMIINEIIDELNVSISKAKNEYLKRMYIKWGKSFAVYNEGLAAALSNKIEKLARQNK